MQQEKGLNNKKEKNQRKRLYQPEHKPTLQISSSILQGYRSVPKVGRVDTFLKEQDKDILIRVRFLLQSMIKEENLVLRIQ